MKETPEAETSRWFRQSELDPEDADFNRSGKRHHLACFLAQQAAEKALKAFLHSAGAETVWGQSVAELCKEAATIDQEFAELLGEAAPLDKYYIPTRYPNGLPGGIPSQAFSPEDSALAIKMGARVLDFVCQRLAVP